jgi:hypothetical protein
MSSQDRIAANRQNAVRSTGPLSSAGKQRSSQNARKHGLSISIRHEPGISNKIEALAVAIAGDNAKSRRLQAARDLAEAQFEYRRLQEFKVSLIEAEAANIHAIPKVTAGGHCTDDNVVRTIPDIARAYMRALPILESLDRYDRRVLARQRKAFQRFAIIDEE